MIDRVFEELGKSFRLYPFQIEETLRVLDQGNVVVIIEVLEFINVLLELFVIEVASHVQMDDVLWVGEELDELQVFLELNCTVIDVLNVLLLLLLVCLLLYWHLAYLLVLLVHVCTEFDSLC